jgi:hypothetical protein
MNLTDYISKLFSLLGYTTSFNEDLFKVSMGGEDLIRIDMASENLTLTQAMEKSINSIITAYALGKGAEKAVDREAILESELEKRDRLILDLQEALQIETAERVQAGTDLDIARQKLEETEKQSSHGPQLIYQEIEKINVLLHQFDRLKTLEKTEVIRKVRKHLKIMATAEVW